MDLNETPALQPLPPAVDLSSCERERIHLPGAIQPYGCLLLCALPTWTISTVSANAGRFFGRASEDLLDQPLDVVMPGKAVHDLRNVLQSSMVSAGAERLLDVPIDEGPERYDLTVHMSAANAIVEIVPRKGANTLATDPVVLVKSMIGQLRRASTLERFLQLAAHQVRAVTGFDRVMIYKFSPDASGQVMAEALRSGLPPFVNLRYPASDIPAQARALYKRQWLRLIPDVNYTPEALIGGSESSVEADLSLASLRSVSPVHLEYLRNMGSNATLTISLMAGDALWGLIACHHAVPRRISTSICAAVELFGQIFSQQIDAKEQARELQHGAQLRTAHDRLMAGMSPDQSVFDEPGRFEDLVKAVIPCAGFGVWSEQEFKGVGLTPPSRRCPTCSATSVKRARRSPTLRLDYRRNWPRPGTTLPRSAVSWRSRSRERRRSTFFSSGARPWRPCDGAEIRKSRSTSKAERRASVHARASTRGVRSSTAIHALAGRGTADRRDAANLSLLGVILRRADRVNRERRDDHERQAFLIAELNHRVKNILTLIRSLVRQSRQNAISMEGFSHDLEHRIRALALAHDQLTQTGWHHAPLRRLLEAEARAWTRSSERVCLSGPGVMVDSRAYQALALVFHEMMTNAAKYGALSQSTGRLTVTWAQDPGGDLRIDWRELGGATRQTAGAPGLRDRGDRADDPVRTPGRGSGRNTSSRACTARSRSRWPISGVLLPDSRRRPRQARRHRR